MTTTRTYQEQATIDILALYQQRQQDLAEQINTLNTVYRTVGRVLDAMMTDLGAVEATVERLTTNLSTERAD